MVYDSHMDDIHVVQKYIRRVIDERLLERYVYCPQCPESDLCMMPWSDGEDVGLFCLFPGCQYRVVLGQSSIDEMKKFLKIA